MKWEVSKETPICYLIKITYKDMQTGEKYAHSEERLNEILNQLCEDKSVYDFKVFVRMQLYCE